MKIIKMIKVVSFSLIAGGLVSASAYAQDIDVTMDVIKQSDAENITERIMKRIDLPGSAQDAETQRKRDHDRLQYRSRMDDGNHEASSSWQHEGVRDAMEDSHQMSDDINDAKDDSHQMRDDVNDAKEDSHQMRDDVNDAKEDSYQMRNDHTMN
jgi:hypothetical protein